MSVQTALVAAMTADAGINAIVSGRIYNTRMPQGNTDDCITFSLAGDVPRLNVGSESVLKDATLTLQLWSLSTATLESLKQAVIAFWHGMDGSLDTEYVAHATTNTIGTDYDLDTKLYRQVVTVELLMRN